MATATTADAGAPPKGKKKLIIIVGAGVVVLLLVLAVVVVMMTKKPPVDEDGEAPAKNAAASAKHDPKAVPVFVPLEPFTVNLADREAERYAQVGITLEVINLQVGDQIKLYMPAIRNNVLMAISDRTAADLQTREGKAKLADKVLRETARVLGYEVEEPEAAVEEEEQPAKSKTKKKKKAAAPELPVKAVHFSNFIIQ